MHLPMFLRVGKMYENIIADVWWPLYVREDSGLSRRDDRYLGFGERFILLEICEQRFATISKHAYHDVRVLTESGDILYMLMQINDNELMRRFFKES